MKYDVDYFIKKFNKIKPSKWCTGVLTTPDGRSCALGHCGMTKRFSPSDLTYEYTSEGLALAELILDHTATHTVLNVNDISYKGLKTPKGRVLACLRDIKKKMK